MFKKTEKENLNVVLLSPGIIKHTDRDFGLPHLVSIGSYLKSKFNIQIKIIDLGYEEGDHNHLKSILKELSPISIIGISCYSSYDYLRTLSIGQFLKLNFPNALLVTGGYHPSAWIFDISPGKFHNLANSVHPDVQGTILRIEFL